jgi:hypothetical protein
MPFVTCGFALVMIMFTDVLIVSAVLRAGIARRNMSRYHRSTGIDRAGSQTGFEAVQCRRSEGMTPSFHRKELLFLPFTAVRRDLRTQSPDRSLPLPNRFGNNTANANTHQLMQSEVIRYVKYRKDRTQSTIFDLKIGFFHATASNAKFVSRHPPSGVPDTRLGYGHGCPRSQ